MGHKRLAPAVAVLACIGILANTNIGSAQCGYPDEGCPSEWNTDTVSVDIGWFNFGYCQYNGTTHCIVTLEYRWRQHCGVCEFEILHLSYDDRECSCPFSYLLRYSIINLLLNPPTSNCSPDPGSCIEMIRVTMNSCWVAEHPSHEWTWGACGTLCCYATYKVCLDTNDQTTITTTSHSTDFECTSGCTPTYDFMDITWP